MAKGEATISKTRTRTAARKVRHVLLQPAVCEVCGLPDPTECRFGHGEDKLPFLRPMSVGQYIDILDGRMPRRLNQLERLAEDLEPEERARYEDVLSRAVSPKEIMARPDLPITQLLGPLVVRGERIMLGAAKGHGKTSMSLQIVRAILFGEEFLGFSGVGDTRALVLDAEQGERSLKRRIVEAGLEDVPRSIMKILPVPEGLVLHSPDRKSHRSRADRISIETELARELYDIVVFDPVYMLHESNSNEERDMVDLMKILDGWKREYDFALLMPAHTRKTGADRYKFTMDDFFGSTGILRNAEVILGLEKKKYGQARLHRFFDRDGDLGELFKDDVWGLRFSRETGFERGEVTDARKERGESSLRKVENALLVEPRSDMDRLRELTGLSRGTIDTCLKKLNAPSDKIGKRKVWWMD